MRLISRFLLVAALSALGAVGQDRIIFSRVFPGSIPEEFEVSLESSARVIYSEPEEEPVEFQIDEGESAVRFGQAEDLRFFSMELASKRRVASSGKKVLRFESNGVVRGEATFDYSDSEVARDLATWFVKIAETEQHLFELERVAQFDRLGINQALVHLESSFERERVVAPQRLVPILTRISTQKNIVHLARARAAGLLERIEAARD